MRRLIREYLASLRERDELDAMLPDLLAELGYTVFSRPSRGTRQMGVDVAAVGPPGEDSVYLFSIKSGNLTRGEWNGASDQALRPSLDEIIDAYIPNRLPPEHSARPVVICPCFGGEVKETVQEQFNTYMRTKTTERVSFEVWDGDRLASHIEEGVLGDGVIPAAMRSSLRKAIALPDEPDVSFGHFKRFVSSVYGTAKGQGEAALLSGMRRVSIALWMLFVWCRDAGNLESAYLAAELVLLRTWDAARDVLAGNDSRSEPLGIVLQELIDLHIRISDELVVRKLLPHAAVRHGLSAAVRSAAPLDVNLQMFSLLGRIALRGLWQLWTDRFGGDLSPQPQPRRGAVAESQADRLADGLCALVGCNPTLFSPTNEEQVVDLGLAFAFLAAHGRREQDLRLWLQETIHRLLFSFSRRSRYPLPDSDYSALAEHQSDPGESFAASTAASVLIPTLALWSAGLSLTEELGVLAQLNKELDHCSMQLWLPGADSEQAIWKTADGHGMALMDIPVGAGPGEILAFVSRECGPSSHFETLSAVAQGIWPLVAVACRHNRLPVPPQMFLQAVGRQHVTEATEPPLEDTLMATNGREHGACPAAATLAE